MLSGVQILIDPEQHQDNSANNSIIVEGALVGLAFNGLLIRIIFMEVLMIENSLLNTQDFMQLITIVSLVDILHHLTKLLKILDFLEVHVLLYPCGFLCNLCASS